MKELCFITVIGSDKKGIIANISGFLYKNSVNIEDISQKVISGYFVMTLLADITDSKISVDEVRAGLDKIGEEMGLKIQVQHENIFKAMHRV
ncbi:ACT domain-containing protein [Candidatus Woesearchaeota archaeon]|nr:ACT domain-containing protein [Candidatus Woesearchaeota archaeon]